MIYFIYVSMYIVITRKWSRISGKKNGIKIVQKCAKHQLLQNKPSTLIWSEENKV